MTEDTEETKPPLISTDHTDKPKIILLDLSAKISGIRGVFRQIIVISEDTEVAEEKQNRHRYSRITRINRKLSF